MMRTPLFSRLPAGRVRALIIAAGVGLFLNSFCLGILMNVYFKPASGITRVIWTQSLAYISFYFLTGLVNALILATLFERPRFNVPRPTWGSLIVPPFWYALACVVTISTPPVIKQAISSLQLMPYALIIGLAVVITVPVLVFLCITMGHECYLAYKSSNQIKTES